MRAVTLIVASAGLALLGPIAPASAAWNDSGDGQAAARAKQMPAGNVPTALVSNRDVTLRWDASSFAGDPAVDGYSVTRYNGAGESQSIGAGCAGVVSDLTCTERGVPGGDWRYSVTPRHGLWSGAESAKSTAATVASPALTLDSASVKVLPGTLTGQIKNFIPGQTVTFRLDDPTTGPTVTGSITPSPVPGDGTAAVSVTVPPGTSNGTHTLYALGDVGDTASREFTVEVSTTISTSAWALRDSSYGFEVNQSSTTAFADGRTTTSGNFATTFSSFRYLQFDYNRPLPSGGAISNARFDFRFADTASGNTACFYFQVRRASTSAVVATSGSAANPVGCVTGTTQQTFSTALPDVAGSDLANDLRLRVYVRESGGSAITVDQATVSGTSEGNAFTLYERVATDASSGFPVNFPWALAAAGDGAAYTSVTNWGTSFSNLRYLRLDFPAYVPSGATLNNVSFESAYRSESSGTTCRYFEVYSGSTLLATKGSAASPFSCNATTSFVTDTVSLPEVDTVAEANSLRIRTYVRNSGGLRSSDDLASLRITYTK